MVQKSGHDKTADDRITLAFKIETVAGLQMYLTAFIIDCIQAYRQNKDPKRLQAANEKKSTDPQ